MSSWPCLIMNTNGGSQTPLIQQASTCRHSFILFYKESILSVANWVHNYSIKCGILWLSNEMWNQEPANYSESEPVAKRIVWFSLLDQIHVQTTLKQSTPNYGLALTLKQSTPNPVSSQLRAHCQVTSSLHPSS